MRDVNETFRKDVTNNNIKSRKKAGLHLLSRKYIFGKSTGAGHLFRVNEVAGIQPSNFIKKRPQRRCFLVKFAKFLREPLFTEHLWWLFLNSTKVEIHILYFR